MFFKDFASCLQKLEATSSRNKMTEILAELFKKASLEEVDKICYLSLGRLAPKFVELEFQMAEKTMLQVLSQAYGAEVLVVKRLFKKLGDLGEVIAHLEKSQMVRQAHHREQSRGTNPKFQIPNSKQKSLTVAEVYKRLMAVALESGAGSVERKIKGFSDLLRKLDSLSAKYVVRVPLGKLRLGFSEMTILDSLSWMARGDKGAKGELEKAYFVTPDVGELARKVKQLGIKKAVLGVKPRVGVPVLPMLAQRLKSPKEMVKKMGKVAVEPKFDGLRVQIHVWKKVTTRKKYLFSNDRYKFCHIFSRNLENVTLMFPEVVQGAKDLVQGSRFKVQGIILDGEAVGVDAKTGKVLAFQETTQRKRKHGILEMVKKIPLRVFLFDVLFLNGESLMDKNYLARRKVLEAVLNNQRCKGKITSKVIEIVDYQLTQDAKEINRLNKENRQKGLEGIIVKKVESGYVPGRTGWRWVKMKEGEGAAGKLPDTLDCLVMGYYLGKGKRTGFGIGAFLVGVRREEEFITLAKIGTGLTDEQWRKLRVQGSRLKAQGKPKEYLVPEELTPDVWLLPSLVVEVAGDDLTKSPIHTSGYALRFPRLVSFREDKSPAEATSLSEVKKLFQISST